MSNLQRVIWLASYPKSGNTWLRNLLAQYFMPEGKAPDINNLRQFTTGDTRRDFYEAAAGEPFVNKSVEEWLNIRPKALRLIAASRPNHHFVKTHCMAVRYMRQDLIPSEVTAAAIYVMRNPFDVVLSYARHLSKDIDTTIDVMTNPDMIVGLPENGIYDALGSWDNNVETWTTAEGLSHYVVRYEDLLAKPAKTMRGLLGNFLKVPVDSPKLARAIKASSFNAMKAFEDKHGFFEKPKDMKSFFAKGQAGVWRDELTPAQVERLRDAFKPTLEKWYPEVLAETGTFLKTAS